LAKYLGRANLPVIIHPEFWNRRRLVLRGIEPLEMPTTSRAALEGVGFAIVEDRQPSFLLDGCALVTGEVPRVTGYEPGFPLQEAWRTDHWEPDPLVLDDQAIVLNVRNEGLVVITGCGHAGVVNIVRCARALTGEDRVCAIVGGGGGKRLSRLRIGPEVPDHTRIAPGSMTGGTGDDDHGTMTVWHLRHVRRVATISGSS